MEGIGGTGLYGEEKALADSLKADRQQLANAPLGPRQRKRLEGRIEETRKRLKAVRTEIRKPAEKKIQEIMESRGLGKTQARKFIRARNKSRKAAEPLLEAIRESTRITGKDLAIVINARAR